MKEGSPNVFEEGPEAVPSPEEVEDIFEKLIESKDFEDIKKLEDEQGLYLWDIKVHGEDGDIEYLYMRKGHYTEGQASKTAINVTFFDESGISVGGHSVAKYIDGEWMLTP